MVTHLKLFEQRFSFCVVVVVVGIFSFFYLYMDAAKRIWTSKFGNMWSISRQWKLLSTWILQWWVYSKEQWWPGGSTCHANPDRKCYNLPSNDKVVVLPSGEGEFSSSMRHVVLRFHGDGQHLEHINELHLAYLLLNYMFFPLKQSWDGIMCCNTWTVGNLWLKKSISRTRSSLAVESSEAFSKGEIFIHL